MNMKVLPIGKLCALKYGKALRKDKRVNGTVPVYGSNGIVDYHNEAAVQAPTIIVGRKGSIGEIHYVDGPSWPIDTTYFVDLLGTYDIDLRWFYRVLGTLRLNELNRAAAVPGLNRADVYRIEIPLPPLEDQKRIAYLLSKVEGLIAQRKQHLQQLDDLLKSVFLDMFGDPVHNEKGWDFGPVETMCERIIDCPHSTPVYSDSETTNYCLRSSDIVDGYIDLSQTFHVDKEIFAERIRRHEPRRGDIVYSREGGRLGNAARVIGSEKVCLGQRMMLFGVNSTTRSEFLWAILESAPFKRKLKGLVGGGAAPRVNIKDLIQISVIRPPEELQNAFAEIVLRMDRIRFYYKTDLMNLELLFDVLSQQAFSGDLDLSRVILPHDNTEILGTTAVLKPRTSNIRVRN